MSKTTIRGRIECQKNILRERLFLKKKLNREQTDWVTKKE